MSILKKPTIADVAKLFTGSNKEQQAANAASAAPAANTASASASASASAGASAAPAANATAATAATPEASAGAATATDAASGTAQAPAASDSKEGDKIKGLFDKKDKDKDKGEASTADNSAEAPAADATAAPDAGSTTEAPAADATAAPDAGSTTEAPAADATAAPEVESENAPAQTADAPAADATAAPAEQENVAPAPDTAAPDASAAADTATDSSAANTDSAAEPNKFQQAADAAQEKQAEAQAKIDAAQDAVQDKIDAAQAKVDAFNQNAQNLINSAYNNNLMDAINNEMDAINNEMDAINNLVRSLNSGTNNRSVTIGAFNEKMFAQQRQFNERMFAQQRQLDELKKTLQQRAEPSTPPLILDPPDTRLPYSAAPSAPPIDEPAPPKTLEQATGKQPLPEKKQLEESEYPDYINIEIAGWPTDKILKAVAFSSEQAICKLPTAIVKINSDATHKELSDKIKGKKAQVILADFEGTVRTKVVGAFFGMVSIIKEVGGGDNNDSSKDSKNFTYILHLEFAGELSKYKKGEDFSGKLPAVIIEEIFKVVPYVTVSCNLQQHTQPEHFCLRFPCERYNKFLVRYLGKRDIFYIVTFVNNSVNKKLNISAKIIFLDSTPPDNNKKEVKHFAELPVSEYSQQTLVKDGEFGTLEITGRNPLQPSGKRVQASDKNLAPGNDFTFSIYNPLFGFGPQCDSKLNLFKKTQDARETLEFIMTKLADNIALGDFISKLPNKYFVGKIVINIEPNKDNGQEPEVKVEVVCFPVGSIPLAFLEKTAHSFPDQLGIVVVADSNMPESEKEKLKGMPSLTADKRILVEFPWLKKPVPVIVKQHGTSVSYSTVGESVSVNCSDPDNLSVDAKAYNAENLPPNESPYEIVLVGSKLNRKTSNIIKTDNSENEEKNGIKLLGSKIGSLTLRTHKEGKGGIYLQNKGTEFNLHESAEKFIGAEIKSPEHPIILDVTQKKEGSELRTGTKAVIAKKVFEVNTNDDEQYKANLVLAPAYVSLGSGKENQENHIDINGEKNSVKVTAGKAIDLNAAGGDIVLEGQTVSIVAMQDGQGEGVSQRQPGAYLALDGKQGDAVLANNNGSKVSLTKDKFEIVFGTCKFELSDTGGVLIACGKTQLKLGPNGEAEIDGVKINIIATGTATLQGGMINLSKVEPGVAAGALESEEKIAMTEVEAAEEEGGGVLVGGAPVGGAPVGGVGVAVNGKKMGWLAILMAMAAKIKPKMPSMPTVPNPGIISEIKGAATSAASGVTGEVSAVKVMADEAKSAATQAAAIAADPGAAAKDLAGKAAASAESAAKNAAARAAASAEGAAKNAAKDAVAKVPVPKTGIERK
jgi:hypothetical protein